MDKLKTLPCDVVAGALQPDPEEAGFEREQTVMIHKDRKAILAKRHNIKQPKSP